MIKTILKIKQVTPELLESELLEGFQDFLKEQNLNPKTQAEFNKCVIAFIKVTLYKKVKINPKDYKLNVEQILQKNKAEKEFSHKENKESIKGTMKPIASFEEFSEIIDVFKEPPFSEPLTIFDKIEEFEGYLKHGLALGCYDENGNIMSFAGLMEEVEEEHTPFFDYDVVKHANPLYIYGLATKNEYRGYGLCSSLVELTDELALKNGTDFVYLRTNKEGSMSAGLCYKQGYQDLMQNGEKVIQVVEFERNDPNADSKDERIFLIKAITAFGDEFLKFTGAISQPNETPKVMQLINS